jgi:hypothetical protein
MAVEYQLGVAFKASSKIFLQTILQYINPKATIEELKGFDGVFWGAVPNAFKITCRSDTWEEFPSRILGIKPSTRATFRLSYTDNAELLMAQTVTKWLQQSKEDAVLLYNGEQIEFLRKDSQLYINRKTDFWRAEYLNLLTIPYTKKDFETL